MRAGPLPVFLLSADDALADATLRCDWPVVRGSADTAEQGFLRSAAAIAVVDARGAAAHALTQAQALADAVEANGAALLVVVGDGEVHRLGAFRDAGATHHLRWPFDDGEYCQALHFAERHAQRVAGRARRLPQPDRAPPTAPDRDPLTGLSDAAAARRWLDARLAGEDGGLALLLLSVSRLDMLNAAFGRGTVDALLASAARRIDRLAARDTRMVARMAGAEFLVGLPSPASAEAACFLGRALIAAMSRPFAAGGTVVTLAAQVGITLAEPGEQTADVMRRASAALAEARAADGDPVRLLSAREEGAAAADGRLEVDLRHALAHDEIGIVYQPQLSVTTGRVVGVEALARWRHPRLGELGAGTLFAAAERPDYLVQLSRHVQDRVVAEVAAWPPALAALRVAINVTAPEIALPGFADEFLARLDGGGVSRDRVTVEVTESGLIEDLRAASRLLSTLRGGGLRISIDDFGTGYSSLAYLTALPLDQLKIDRSLAQDIVGSARDRVVVRGVIDMARSLGLSVVAEGVETTEQLGLLAQEGCTFYQGFLFSAPLETSALATLVSGWQADGVIAR